MANWIWNTYDTIKAAETAVETINNSVTIHVFGFKEGALQKIIVVKKE